jgi:hypothetical protein
MGHVVALVPGARGNDSTPDKQLAHRPFTPCPKSHNFSPCHAVLPMRWSATAPFPRCGSVAGGLFPARDSMPGSTAWMTRRTEDDINGSHCADASWRLSRELA